MSGIQVPPRSLRVDADAQDADGRAQPRRLFTEPSTASSDALTQQGEALFRFVYGDSAESIESPPRPRGA